MDESVGEDRKIEKGRERISDIISRHYQYQRYVFLPLSNYKRFALGILLFEKTVIENFPKDDKHCDQICTECLGLSKNIKL